MKADPFRYSESARIVILNDDGVWSGEATIAMCSCRVLAGGALSTSKSCPIHGEGDSPA